MFKREQLKILKARVAEPRRFIQTLLGPRQVGKTTLIDQLINEIKIPFYSVVADDTQGNDTVWIDQQLEAARLKLRSSGANELLLIIDEIQKIENWSEAVKKNWDLDTSKKTAIKVILLGSSRLMLQKGLTESLAGRFEVIPIMHWSYAEMNKAFGYNADEYVWFGGYPGAASLIKDEQRWKEYIRHSLVETTISKDILMLTRIDKPALLKRLFELSCAYSGQILSYNKMLGQLHDAGNTTTLSHYLDLLDASGLVTGLEKYSKEQLRTRASSPKLQVMNTALFSIFSNTTLKQVSAQPAEWGRHVESAIGAHLVNNAKSCDMKVFYWREQNDEVDFVLQKKNKIIAIEVKSGKNSKAPGMSAFSKKFKPYKTLLVGKPGISWQEFLKINPAELF